MGREWGKSGLVVGRMWERSLPQLLLHLLPSLYSNFIPRLSSNNSQNGKPRNCLNILTMEINNLETPILLFHSSSPPKPPAQPRRRIQDFMRRVLHQFPSHQIQKHIRRPNRHHISLRRSTSPGGRLLVPQQPSCEISRLPCNLPRRMQESLPSQAVIQLTDMPRLLPRIWDQRWVDCDFGAHE